MLIEVDKGYAAPPLSPTEREGLGPRVLLLALCNRCDLVVFQRHKRGISSCCGRVH